VVTRDFSEEFQRQLDAQRLQVSRDEQTWVERFAPPERATPVIMNFGCGTQYTPHLMVETVSVFAALGVDLVAVAGPQWCCGQPYVDGGVPGSGRNMTTNSTRRMAAFGPRETVHWCGAWWPRLADAFPGRAPVALTHVTTFLARILLERAGRIEWKADVSGGVLMHLKSRDRIAFSDRGSVMAAIEASVPAALETIPGIRIVGHVPTLSGGLPCATGADGRGTLDLMTDDAVATMRDELAAAAAAAGARLVVTAHHACQREWGKLGDQRLPVRHLISLVAAALGVGEPDRYQEYWRLRDPDAIVVRAREAWMSWGMSAEKARAIAVALFGRS
jgi:hypothetical protein